MNNLMCVGSFRWKPGGGETPCFTRSSHQQGQPNNHQYTHIIKNQTIEFAGARNKQFKSKWIKRWIFVIILGEGYLKPSSHLASLLEKIASELPSFSSSSLQLFVSTFVRFSFSLLLLTYFFFSFLLVSFT
jgi:hypothetical protein